MSKGTSGFDFLRSAFGLLSAGVQPEPVQGAEVLHKAAESVDADAVREIAAGMLHESEWKFSGHFAFTGINTCVLRSTGAHFNFPVPSWLLLKDAGEWYARALTGSDIAKKEIMLILLKKARTELFSMFAVVAVIEGKNEHIVTCSFIGSHNQFKFSLNEKFAKLF